jgi:hypothetical protein
VAQRDAEIVTIEGLAGDQDLHPLQRVHRPRRLPVRLLPRPIDHVACLL